MPGPPNTVEIGVLPINFFLPRQESRHGTGDLNGVTSENVQKLTSLEGAIYSMQTNNMVVER